MKNTKLTPGVQSTLRRLGSNIQTARRKRRLSQADLALSMGVSVGTLKRLEAGGARRFDSDTGHGISCFGKSGSSGGCP